MAVVFLVSPCCCLSPQPLLARFCLPSHHSQKLPCMTYLAHHWSRGHLFSGTPPESTHTASIRFALTKPSFSHHFQAQSEHARTLQRDGTISFIDIISRQLELPLTIFAITLVF